MILPHKDYIFRESVRYAHTDLQHSRRGGRGRSYVNVVSEPKRDIDSADYRRALISVADISFSAYIYERSTEGVHKDEHCSARLNELTECVFEIGKNVGSNVYIRLAPGDMSVMRATTACVSGLREGACFRRMRRVYSWLTEKCVSDISLGLALPYFIKVLVVYQRKWLIWMCVDWGFGAPSSISLYSQVSHCGFVLQFESMKCI